MVPIHLPLLVETGHHHVGLLLLYVPLKAVVGGAELLVVLAGRFVVVVLEEVLGASSGSTAIHGGHFLEGLAHDFVCRIFVGCGRILLPNCLILSLLG